MSAKRVYEITHDDEVFRVTVERTGPNVGGSGHRYRIWIDDASPIDVDACRPSPQLLSLIIADRSWEVGLVENGVGYEVDVLGWPHHLDVIDPHRTAVRTVSQVGRGEIRTEIPGRVVRVLVTEGEMVEIGQSVVVVEAMKMENELAAQRAGVVEKIHCVVGEQVEAKTVLISVGDVPVSQTNEETS